jgi:hypothetical protein
VHSCERCGTGRLVGGSLLFGLHLRHLLSHQFAEDIGERRRGDRGAAAFSAINLLKTSFLPPTPTFPDSCSWHARRIKSPLRGISMARGGISHE